ncbi:hypothetical protein FOG24_15515, partial [Klebsiella grimontii]|nr:hypothetical protein [Klebsiella grimontii]
VGKMRDLILQLSKSSIYSTKPPKRCRKFLEWAIPQAEHWYFACQPLDLNKSNERRLPCHHKIMKTTRRIWPTKSVIK